MNNKSRLKALLLNRYAVWLVLLCLILPVNNGFAARIAVEIERNPIQVNESVQINFIATEVPDGEPDFSPLEQDFEILNQGFSSQESNINGTVTRSQRWVLSVMPKHSGLLTVPQISFGNDRSTSYLLNVKAAAQRNSKLGKGEVFLEVEATPQNPYVQAQILYTVRIFHRIGIASANLSKPDLPGAVVEQLSDGTKYTTQIAGLSYEVFEIQYAVFPQASGQLTIPPVKLTAEVLTGKSSGRLFSRNITEQRRFGSEPVQLNVRPVPAAFNGRVWLPAAELNLTENWSDNPAAAIAGEPVTRSIAIHAVGLTKSQLPELGDLQSQKLPSDAIKLYPDQPALTQAADNKGVVSRREEKTAFVTNEAGNYKLPAIEIPWWNTTTDQMEIASLPAVNLLVGAAPAGYKSNPIPIVNAQQQNSASTAIMPQAEGGLWKWLSLFLGLGWLLTGIAFYWFMRKTNTKKPGSTQNTTRTPDSIRRRSGRDLRLACQMNQATEASAHLLKWASGRWSDNPPTNLAEVGQRLSALKPEIDKLESVLYNPTSSNWNGDQFWELFKAHRRDEVVDEEQAKPSLEPLYKA